MPGAQEAVDVASLSRQAEALRVAADLAYHAIAPIASVAVDTPHDGLIYVSGVDRNRDGIPDVMQKRHSAGSHRPDHREWPAAAPLASPEAPSAVHLAPRRPPFGSIPISDLHSGESIRTQCLLDNQGKLFRVVRLDCGNDLALCSALSHLEHNGRDLRYIRCAGTLSNLASLAAFLGAGEWQNIQMEPCRVFITESRGRELTGSTTFEGRQTCDVEFSALCSVLASRSDRVRELQLAWLDLSHGPDQFSMHLRPALGRNSSLCILAIHDMDLNLAALAPCISEWCRLPDRHQVRQRSLEFQRCALEPNPDGISAFAAVLPSCATLVSLELATCGIGSDGAICLANALAAAPALQRLCLRGNHISDNGALAFANLLETQGSNSMLADLNLEFNEIGLFGVGSLRQTQRKFLINGDAHCCRLHVEGNPGVTIHDPALSIDWASAQSHMDGTYPWRHQDNLAVQRQVCDPYGNAGTKQNNFVATPSLPGLDELHVDTLGRSHGETLFAHELHSNGSDSGALRELAATILAKAKDGWRGSVQIVVNAAPPDVLRECSYDRAVDVEWAQLCDTLGDAGLEVSSLNVDTPLTLRGGSFGFSVSLAKLLRSCKRALRRLRVRHNPSEAQVLVGTLLEGCTELENLDLQLSCSNSVELNSFGPLASSLLTLPKLETLGLPSSNIRSDGLTMLAGAMTAASITRHKSQPLQLRHIQLSRNAIADAGAWSFANCLDTAAAQVSPTMQSTTQMLAPEIEEDLHQIFNRCDQGHDRKVWKKSLLQACKSSPCIERRLRDLESLSDDYRISWGELLEFYTRQVTHDTNVAQPILVAPLLIEVDLSFNLIVAAGAAALMGMAARRAQVCFPLRVHLHGNPYDLTESVAIPLASNLLARSPNPPSNRVTTSFSEFNPAYLLPCQASTKTMQHEPSETRPPRLRPVLHEDDVTLQYLMSQPRSPPQILSDEFSLRAHPDVLRAPSALECNSRNEDLRRGVSRNRGWGSTVADRRKYGRLPSTTAVAPDTFWRDWALEPVPAHHWGATMSQAPRPYNIFFNSADVGNTTWVAT